jgi:hypothetical protein
MSSYPPAPADVWDRLSTERIEQGLATEIAGDEILSRALREGMLRWALDGFDPDGFASVTVMTDHGGIVGTGRVHWSAITAPDD